jgi:hypothetical protein
MLIKKNMGIFAIVVLLVATVVIYANPIQSAAAQPSAVQKGGISVLKRAVPIATEANNVYLAWPNNDTGHWNVFFAKSTDGGKTFAKNIMLSAPNKGHVVDQDIQIAASGSNVYVTWWTNKTGTLMPVFRASTDNGDTFAKAITLNSTG